MTRRFPRLRTVRLPIAVFCCLAAVPPLEAAEPKPLAIAAGYFELSCLYRDFPQRYPYYYQTALRGVPAASLGRYGTVIVAQGGRILDADAKGIESFLRQGGNLVLVGKSAEPFLGMLPNLFGRQARLVNVNGPGFASEASPLFEEAVVEDLDELDAPGKWGNVPIQWALSGATGGRALLHRQNDAAVWVRDVGRG